MKWVEASGPGFGNGGPNWVEDNLEGTSSSYHPFDGPRSSQIVPPPFIVSAFVNIAGPMLGVAKSV